MATFFFIENGAVSYTLKVNHKKYLKKMGEITHRLIVGASIEIGQIVAKNLFGKKIDLVATRKVDIKN
jgi:CxxC motif-containing protein